MRGRRGTELSFRTTLEDSEGVGFEVDVRAWVSPYMAATRLDPEEGGELEVESVSRVDTGEDVLPSLAGEQLLYIEAECFDQAMDADDPPDSDDR